VDIRFPSQGRRRRAVPEHRLRVGRVGRTA
jgi:hypothetical protein